MQEYIITKGDTSRIITVSIYDSSSTTGAKLAGLVFNSAGLTAYYNRAGAAGVATAITLVTATKGTWVSSGFVAIDGTNMPGDYELHIPDAVIASGVDEVDIQLKGATNMVPVNIKIHLIAQDLQVASVAQTGDNYTRIGAAGASLTDLGGMSTAMKAQVNTEADTALTDYDPPTNAEMIARTRLDADYFSWATDTVANVTLVATTTTNTDMRGTDGALTDKAGFALSATGADLIPYNSTFLTASAKANWSDTLVTYTDGMAGKRVKGITAVPALDGTVNDAAATTTSFISTLTGYGDTFFDDALMIVEIATDQWQARPVATYTSTTGAFTFDEAFISAPANGVAISVLITHIHTVADIQAGLATEAKQDIIDTVVDAVKVKTDKLTFTSGNDLDVNIQKVNDVTITGTGGSGTEWGP